MSKQHLTAVENRYKNIYDALLEGIIEMNKICDGNSNVNEVFSAVQVIDGIMTAWSNEIKQLCDRCVKQRTKTEQPLPIIFPQRQPVPKKPRSYASINTFSNLIYEFKCKFNPIVLDNDYFIDALSELIKNWLFTFSFISLTVYGYAKLIAKIFNEATRENYVISKCRSVESDRVSVENSSKPGEYSCGRAVKGLNSFELEIFGVNAPRFNTRIIIYATKNSENDIEDEVFYEEIVHELIEKAKIKENAEIKENVDEVPIMPVIDVPVAEEPENKKMDGGGLYRYKYNKNKYLSLIRLRAKN
jgi:hypothetical protein